MSYKQYTDRTLYTSDLTELNAETVNNFQGCTFQDTIKHPLREEYYINFSRMDILNKLKSIGSTLVTDAWLTTDIINDLPTDFKWSDLTRPYRLVCDSMSILNHITEQSDLGKILVQLLGAFVGQIFNMGTNTFIYLANLTPYDGVDANVLVATYPTTFLRIDIKTK